MNQFVKSGISIESACANLSDQTDFPESTTLELRSQHDEFPHIDVKTHQAYSPLDTILSRLTGVKRTIHDQWLALCPSHDDHNPSLSISQGDDGRALVKCHAGCKTAEVLHALNLTEADLFPVSTAGQDHPAFREPKIVACYDYRDASGDLLYQVVRYEPKDFRQRRPDGKGRWIWNIQGVPSIPYCLPKLLIADPADFVFIPEGEADADALMEIGLAASTNSGGADGWGRISDLSAFRECRVVIIPDRDEPGQRHADEIAKSLQGIAKETRILDLGKIDGFEGKDISDWLDCLDDREPDEIARALLEMAADSPFWGGTGCPSSAGLFDREDSLLPSFPVDALPSWLGEMAKGTAISMQTPVDLPATIALGVLSLICGGVKVEVRDLWNEPLNLYVACVLPVACRKTSCFDAMLKPVRDFEKALQAEAAPLISKARVKRDFLGGRLQKLKKSVASHDLDSTAQEEASSLAVEVDSMEIPAHPILFTSDVTPEGVVRMLEEQKGRAAVFSDEGGELIANISGRYSKDGQCNMEVFLKAHAGTSIRVYRADRNRTPVLVDNPALSMVLCLQPAVMERVWQREDLHERGMIARFFWSVPSSPLGHRKSRPPSCNHEVVARYQSVVSSLLRMRFFTGGYSNTGILRLSPEALDLALDLHDELEPEVGHNGRYEYMAGWLGKLTGAAVRIAGVLHVAACNEPNDSPYSRAIDKETMINALRIARYFLAQAENAYAFFGSTDEKTMQNRIQRWVQKNGFDSFTEHELIRNLGVKKERIIKPLKILQDKGCIEEAPENSREKAGKPGRKPSRKWTVLPQAMSSSGDSVNFVNGVAR